ncbi:MAG TPA: hypothetical protein DDX72_02700, partial [Ruminococcaceae bacterium]|nr:hypothetical protein [Oscillospiraceae bacterium]
KGAGHPKPVQYFRVQCYGRVLTETQWAGKDSMLKQQSKANPDGSPNHDKNHIIIQRGISSR